MKVTGPGRVETSKIKGTARRGGEGSSSFADALDDVSSTERTSAASPAGPVTTVDSLFALQEAPVERRSKREELDRADDILKLLEAVRRGLILGTLTDAALKQIGKLLSDRRHAFSDPSLGPVVREIELRAAVELAKRGL